MICLEDNSLRKRYSLLFINSFQSVLSVYTKDMKTLIGEADFDLAKYANEERS